MADGTAARRRARHPRGDRRGRGAQLSTAAGPPGYDGVPDAALLARSAAGDPAAFGEVVRRHRDRLWAVALRTLGDREEAADALQDALVSALRAAAAGSYRGEAAVTTWLHRIVVNACLDRVRRRAARPAVPLPERDGAPGALPAGRDDIAARETAIVVHDALATLPVEQRVALVLVDLHGFPVADAAAVLGVPPGTVKSRCARGRARLLPLLADLREAAGSARNRPGAGAVPPPMRPPRPGDGT